MKRVIAVILALVLCLALAACGGGGTKDSVKVDIFWYDFSDTFLTSVRNAFITELDAVEGIEYTMHDCENDQALETEKVETAITQGTDLLIVNIVTTGSVEAAQAICDMAKEAGIPIVFFNREVDDSVVKSYDKCVFVGTDPDEAGYMQGQMIAEYLLKDDNLTKYDLDGDKEIAYIMLRGEHANAEAFGRTKYSIVKANELLAASGVKLVPSPANETSTQYEDDGISNYFLYANWSAANATALMGTALTAYSLTSGDIEMVIGNNDDAALGAIEAMNEEGYNTGADGAGYIPVFGVDATAVAQEAMTAGKMTGSILQSATGMAAGLTTFVKNVAAGSDLLANTGSYNFDEGVNKIRIAYEIVI